MNEKLPILKTDPEFQTLILPLTKEEYEKLEKSIIADGCHEPIYVWQGYIIDGYERYEICHKHGIGFMIETVELKSKEDVIYWICTRQLNKQDIPEKSRCYLIGRKYDAEKTVGIMNITGHNQHTIDAIERKPHTGKTAVKIGLEYHLSHSTVNKYSQYSKAVDRLREEIPNIANMIIDGRIKISQDNLIELSKKSAKEIKNILERSYRRTAEKTGKASFEMHILDVDLPPVPKGSVKDMPVFDPDAYVSSLTLTIPSWVSTIKRTAANSDMETISLKAKKDLIRALDELISISTVVKIRLEG